MHLGYLVRLALPRPCEMHTLAPTCTGGGGGGGGRRECNAHRPRCTAGPPDACMHPRRVTLVFYHVKHRGGCAPDDLRGRRDLGAREETGGSRGRGPRRERYSRYSNESRRSNCDYGPAKRKKITHEGAFIFRPTSSIRSSRCLMFPTGIARAAVSSAPAGGYETLFLSLAHRVD